MLKKFLELLEKSNLRDSFPRVTEKLLEDKSLTCDNKVIKFFNWLEFIVYTGVLSVYPKKLADNITITDVVNPVCNVPDSMEFYKVAENVRTLALFISRFLMESNFYYDDITINSWYRNEYVNIIVGGVSNSYHRLGAAVDICPSNVEDYDIFKSKLVDFVKNNQYVKIIFYDKKKFVHIQLLNPKK